MATARTEVPQGRCSWEERVRFHNLISETASDNKVVILSTHIVADVSNLCTRMAIIREGKILSACTPREAVDLLCKLCVSALSALVIILSRKFSAAVIR